MQRHREEEGRSNKEERGKKERGKKGRRREKEGGIYHEEFSKSLEGHLTRLNFLLNFDDKE